VTVVGYAAGEDQIANRQGASPGEIVAVTGTLGGSAAALEAITDDRQSPNQQKQFHPTPLFAAGQALVASRATAMIDISDGLARDAGQLASASDVAIEIDLSKLPLAESVTDAKAAAESGEEYELLCTLRPEDFEAAADAVASTGTTLTEIGRVLQGSAAMGSGASFLGSDGRPVAVAGYQHFD
jgi:thiamine-monophosphate kinase